MRRHIWNKEYFRVAVLHKKSIGRLFKENTTIIVDEMKKAAKLNADILLIPECYITGYELPITKLGALDDSSEYLQSICNAAKEYKIGIVATALMLSDTLQSPPTAYYFHQIPA